MKRTHLTQVLASAFSLGDVWSPAVVGGDYCSQVLYERGVVCV